MPDPITTYPPLGSGFWIPTSKVLPEHGVLVWVHNLNTGLVQAARLYLHRGYGLGDCWYFPNDPVILPARTVRDVPTQVDLWMPIP